jgi:hypothetical protein
MPKFDDSEADVDEDDADVESEPAFELDMLQSPSELGWVIRPVSIGYFDRLVTAQLWSDPTANRYVTATFATPRLPDAIVLTCAR